MSLQNFLKQFLVRVSFLLIIQELIVIKITRLSQNMSSLSGNSYIPCLLLKVIVVRLPFIEIEGNKIEHFKEFKMIYTF